MLPVLWGMPGHPAIEKAPRPASHLNSELNLNSVEPMRSVTRMQAGVGVVAP
jgi:hypothetical protein